MKYYYGVHELSWLVFNNPHLLYEEYHVERKNFLEALAQELWEQEKGCCVKKEEGNKRIAILVDGLHGKVYASARLEIYIANEFAKGLQFVKDAVLQAVVSRAVVSGEKFAEKYGCTKVYTDLQQMLDAEPVDVVYLAIPNSVHYSYIMAILEAGIPILSEKPMVDNRNQLKQVLAKAKEKDLFLMEGMWYP